VAGQPEVRRGAGEIAAFLFGKPRGEREAANTRQRAYKAISGGSIPTFRLGGMIHARKSAILRPIEEQERRGERGRVRWAARRSLLSYPRAGWVGWHLPPTSA